jgi:hypothetical protein
MYNFFLDSKSSSNTEKIPRGWFIYSSSQKMLHCLPYVLFSENLTDPMKAHSDLEKWEGFSPMKVPWKKS